MNYFDMYVSAVSKNGKVGAAYVIAAQELDQFIDDGDESYWTIKRVQINHENDCHSEDVFQEYLFSILNGLRWISINKERPATVYIHICNRFIGWLLTHMKEYKKELKEIRSRKIFVRVKDEDHSFIKKAIWLAKVAIGEN